MASKSTDQIMFEMEYCRSVDSIWQKIHESTDPELYAWIFYSSMMKILMHWHQWPLELATKYCSSVFFGNPDKILPAKEVQKLLVRLPHATLMKLSDEFDQIMVHNRNLHENYRFKGVDVLDSILMLAARPQYNPSPKHCTMWLWLSCYADQPLIPETDLAES